MLHKVQKKKPRKDRTRAALAQDERGRLEQLLRSAEEISRGDRLAILALLNTVQETFRKRCKKSEAKHVAVYYFEYLKPRAIATMKEKLLHVAIKKLGANPSQKLKDQITADVIKEARVRLSSDMKWKVAEDAIFLTRGLYPSAKITVYDMIGIDGSNGLVDAKPAPGMRSHFERVFNPLDFTRLPEVRRARYL